MTSHDNTSNNDETQSPPKAKIYTRTGDKGTTRLVDGSCVEKFNPRVEAYGCVDELNSVIGWCRAESQGLKNSIQDLDLFLEHIQNKLFDLGSLLACEKDDVFQMLPPVTKNNIERIEKEIDRLSSQVPELRQFILPGGHKLAAALHMARTACRRAERRSAEIMIKDSRYENSLQYLNRLSDYLFVASRWVNYELGTPEHTWKKGE